MLIMKTQCERCRAELGQAADAHICSYECTFCAGCADELELRCPNCSGELVPRPKRTDAGTFGAAAGLANTVAGRLRVEAGNFTAPRQVPNVSVERELAAPARAIFDVLAAPARHAEIDGSGTLRAGDPTGPERLYLGATFGMPMSQQGVKYVSSNEVVEFVENRSICWQTFGSVRGVKLIGGQKWRYELLPVEGEPGRTLVRATYDWSEAIAGRFTVEGMGFPGKARQAMSASLRRLETAASAAPGQPG